MPRQFWLMSHKEKLNYQDDESLQIGLSIGLYDYNSNNLKAQDDKKINFPELLDKEQNIGRLTYVVQKQNTQDSQKDSLTLDKSAKNNTEYMNLQEQKELFLSKVSEEELNQLIYKIAIIVKQKEEIDNIWNQEIINGELVKESPIESLSANLNYLNQVLYLNPRGKASIATEKYAYLKIPSSFPNKQFTLNTNSVYIVDLLPQSAYNFMQSILNERVLPTNQKELQFLLLNSYRYYLTKASNMLGFLKHEFTNAAGLQMLIAQELKDLLVSKSSYQNYFSFSVRKNIYNLKKDILNKGTLDSSLIKLLQDEQLNIINLHKRVATIIQEKSDLSANYIFDRKEEFNNNENNFDSSSLNSENVEKLLGDNYLLTNDCFFKEYGFNIYTNNSGLLMVSLIELQQSYLTNPQIKARYHLYQEFFKEYAFSVYDPEQSYYIDIVKQCLYNNPQVIAVSNLDTYNSRITQLRNAVFNLPFITFAISGIECGIFSQLNPHDINSNYFIGLNVDYLPILGMNFLISTLTHELGHWIDNCFMNMSSQIQGLHLSVLELGHHGTWSTLTELCFGNQPTVYSSISFGALSMLRKLYPNHKVSFEGKTLNKLYVYLYKNTPEGVAPANKDALFIAKVSLNRPLSERNKIGYFERSFSMKHLNSGGGNSKTCSMNIAQRNVIIITGSKCIVLDQDLIDLRKVRTTLPKIQYNLNNRY